MPTKLRLEASDATSLAGPTLDGDRAPLLSPDRDDDARALLVVDAIKRVTSERRTRLGSLFDAHLVLFMLFIPFPFLFSLGRRLVGNCDGRGARAFFDRYNPSRPVTRDSHVDVAGQHFRFWRTFPRQF